MNTVRQLQKSMARSARVLLMALMVASLLLGLVPPVTSHSTLSGVGLFSMGLYDTVQAQSQNEVDISVLYDGTPSYSATGANDFDSWQGAAPQTHTPS